MVRLTKAGADRARARGLDCSSPENELSCAFRTLAKRRHVDGRNTRRQHAVGPKVNSMEGYETADGRASYSSAWDHFADRLTEGVTRTGTPVLVGLDPRFEQLPSPLVREVQHDSPGGRAAAYLRFCVGIIDVVAPLVAAVKPQMAFFEELGPAGMASLGGVISYAHEHGLIVILDGKRNDIGSTAEAYANAYLGPTPQSAWGADALTVSPYLGDDSLTPFVDVAKARGAGIFVLAKTSNPGGGKFQDLLAGGEPVYRHVARQVEGLAAQSTGHCGYGAVGAVVGATYPEQLAELRSAMPHTLLLVPGYGSQGAGARDVAAAFDADGQGALINSSRAIIFAHARREYAETYGAAHWQEAVEAATREMIDELRSDTAAGKLAN
jgi:orotidine-5'-phosphate decarboxylase